MPADCCLRPEFTKQLKRHLLKGESINLIAPHGQGRRRTLQDLRSLLPYSHSMQQLDLRRDRIDPNQWLSEVIDNSVKTLLILHNIDEPGPNGAPVNNPQFIAQLNRLQQLSNISLLCVSEHALDSQIQCKPLSLPPLTISQIMQELATREPQRSQVDLAIAASEICSSPTPYTTLLSGVSEAVRSS